MRMVTTTRMSLKEFLALPDIDERRLELIDGEVYEKASPRWGHGRIAYLLARALDDYGFAAVEPRAIIPPGADRASSSPLPDVAFYRSDPPDEDDWMRTPPDVAVEVMSPGQSRAELRAKAAIYVDFGIEAVWVVDAERRSIDVYEGGMRRTLSGDDVLTCAGLPGFSLVVRGLFEEIRGTRP